MTFGELKIISKPHYYSISLDKYFPKFLRNLLRKGSVILALVSFVLSFDSLPFYYGFADGLFFLFIFVYLLLSFLEFFYRSMKNEGLGSLIREKNLKENKKLDFALSTIVFGTKEIDITKAFFDTKIGQEIFLRLGLSLQEFKDFIYSNRQPVMSSAVNISNDDLDLVSYAKVVYEVDKGLQSFLAQNSINKDEFLGTVHWIKSVEEKNQKRERFWGRENLGKIPSIGTSWAYGVSTDLGKFGIPFERKIDLSSLDIENGYRISEISLLEGVLERKKEANAIIIDDDESVAVDIVGRLLRKIKLGTVPPLLEHKNIIELDWFNLTASFKDKSSFEKEILKIFNQTAAAGNTIFFIRDLAGFISSAKSSGINLQSLLSSHLDSPDLLVIASVSNSDFHFVIETSPTILEKFERIIPNKTGVQASMNALLEKVPDLESQYGFYFSYPSILALANAAERFITYGEMPNKAFDLMIEISPWAKAKNISILKEDDVLSFVSEKTGTPAGGVKEKEAYKIEHLEELLHKRIVGQEEAVNGVASAIRRARSGVSNPNRPLASFLFVGPTGVGKTEVSKALAESFFGDEKKMVRFDMSEYSGPDAIGRLIGDFAINKSGILASTIRDNPYGVLLLDEFEKAAPDVLDLFLQVLDEGIFTDALGKQVVCRNLIIIATSNAGSSIIWETIKSGNNLLKSKEVIIDSIIKDKIFRPELLNRFDGIILFHPLQKKELLNIAKICLEKLARRLREQNLELVINEDVVSFLVEKGGDPNFGGRSINRAIQNEIEDIIARKIVSGEARPGSKIEIKKEELL